MIASLNDIAELLSSNTNFSSLIFLFEMIETGFDSIAYPYGILLPNDMHSLSIIENMIINTMVK